MLTVFLEGFALSFGLIVALGPQNAFVLRQNLSGDHAVFATSMCFCADVLMLSMGVMGVGRFVAESPFLAQVLGWGGVAFLMWFIGRSIKQAIKGEYVLVRVSSDESDLKARPLVRRQAIFWQAMAFSLLNPWAYVDTMVLIGGVSVQYEGEVLRALFLLGTIVASAVWFYGLGLSAKFAAPYFNRAITWRILDTCIALIMLAVASGLVHHQLGF